MRPPAEGSPASTLTPGHRLGPYEIVAPVGTGALGTVYRAHDTVQNRTVALKVLRVGAGTDEASNIAAQVRSAATLSHPHIAKVYGLEEADGHAFIVSEFVDGEPLRALTRDGLPFEQVLAYARQIADALACAHRQNTVHGALSSSNVFVTRSGQITIVDFGIEADSLADVYLSPERLRGELGPQGDVWALGILLWEITTGEFPFSGQSAAEIRSSIMYSPIVSPPLAWSEALMAVVFRCLSKSADGRYKDGSALAAALKAVPVTPGQHLWVRLRPFVWGAAALVGVAAIAVPAYTYLLKPKLAQPRAVAAEPATAAPVPVRTTTVAVLPFRPVDASTDDAALELGFADALTTGLSAVPGVKLRPVTAVLPYLKPIDSIAAARELGVERAIEGTIQTADNGRLRVVVRLLDVASGNAGWTETFVADSTGPLGLVDAITRRIGPALYPPLDQQTWETRPKHSTLSADAFRAYLDGRYYWHQGTDADLRKAITSFERAVALDPAYALASVGIAESQTVLGRRGAGPVATTIERARVAALQAVQSDDGLAEGHAALAHVRWIYDWNWEQAEREFKRAIEANPNLAAAHQQYARFLASRGRFPEAQTEIAAARELDPQSLSVRTDAGEIAVWARQVDTALTELRGVLDRDQTVAAAHRILGLAHVLQGRAAEGVEALERAHQIDNSPPTTAALAYAAAIAGSRSRAESLLAELTAASKRRYVSPFAFTLIYVGLGNHDQAFTWLERAIQERSDAIATLDISPWLDPIRKDLRFDGIVNRIEANRYH